MVSIFTYYDYNTLAARRLQPIRVLHPSARRTTSAYWLIAISPTILP